MCMSHLVWSNVWWVASWAGTWCLSTRVGTFVCAKVRRRLFLCRCHHHRWLSSGSLRLRGNFPPLVG